MTVLLPIYQARNDDNPPSTTVQRPYVRTAISWEAFEERVRAMKSSLRMSERKRAKLLKELPKAIVASDEAMRGRGSVRLAELVGDLGALLAKVNR